MFGTIERRALFEVVLPRPRIFCQCVGLPLAWLCLGLFLRFLAAAFFQAFVSAAGIFCVVELTVLGLLVPLPGSRLHSGGVLSGLLGGCLVLCEGNDPFLYGAAPGVNDHPENGLPPEGCGRLPWRSVAGRPLLALFCCE